MTVQRKYGMVESTFWQRPKVRKLDPREKLALIYLFTNKHSNQIGLYQLPYLYMASDLNMTVDTVCDTVSTLCRQGFVRVDTEYEMVWIKGWWGHNQVCNPSQAKHCQKVFDELPDSPIKDEYIAELPQGFTVGMGTGDDTVSTQCRDGVVDRDDRVPSKRTKEKKNKRTKINARARERLYTPDFEVWWKAYPRKTAKPKALESYAKLRADGVSAKAMLDGLNKACKEWEAEGTEPRYVPYPATWLNQRRFEDEPMTAKPKKPENPYRPESFI